MQNDASAGWPEGAREAVARAVRADSGGALWTSPEKIADYALTALAPFLAAQAEEAMDTGATKAIEILARALGVKQWEGGDGTETWDGDVSVEIGNVLKAAGVYEDENGTVATHAALAAQAVAMRDRCARAAMVEVGWNTGTKEARKAIAFQAAHTVNAIRALSIPHADALAAALAEARKAGLREAAAKVRVHAAAAKRCSDESDVIHRIRAEYLAKAFALNAAADDIEAAIRAAMEKEAE